MSRSGAPCGMPALKGRNLCFNHDPLAAIERGAARKRGGALRPYPARAGVTAASSSLRSAFDILREAEELLCATKELQNSARRTSAVVAVLNMSLKAIEVGEYEARLAALEQLVGGHRGWPTVTVA